MPLNLEILPAFILAALALNLTPGADMTFVAAQSMSAGPRAGFAGSIGVGTGGLAHTLFAAVGPAALVAANPVAFEIIRYAGATYLVWMAIQMIRTPPHLGADNETGSVNLARAFSRGFLTNLLNPKVIVFILAFLPQFVDQGAGQIGLQILLLGAIFSTGGTMVLIAVALAGGRLASSLNKHPMAPRIIGWISGTLIGGLAIGLLLSARRAA